MRSPAGLHITHLDLQLGPRRQLPSPAPPHELIVHLPWPLFSMLDKVTLWGISQGIAVIDSPFLLNCSR